MCWNYVVSSPTVIYVTQCYFPWCPEERLDDIGSLITSLVTRSHINSKCLQWLNAPAMVFKFSDNLFHFHLCAPWHGTSKLFCLSAPAVFIMPPEEELQIKRKQQISDWRKKSFSLIQWRIVIPFFPTTLSLCNPAMLLAACTGDLKHLEIPMINKWTSLGPIYWKTLLVTFGLKK